MGAKKGMPKTATHCEALAKSQQNRALNSNNSTGHKNISMHKRTGRYVVDVAGTYCGMRATLSEAIKLRDESRKRLLEYANDN